MCFRMYVQDWRVDQICKLAALNKRSAQAASSDCVCIYTRYHWPLPAPETPTNLCLTAVINCRVCNVRETSEPRSSSRPHTHTWSRNTWPAFIRPPLPPFMWNGSLPADKSIGFALWTPTCDNKRLYRQPTAWNNGTALQLKAKYTPVMAEE